MKTLGFLKDGVHAGSQSLPGTTSWSSEAPVGGPRASIAGTHARHNRLSWFCIPEPFGRNLGATEARKPLQKPEIRFLLFKDESDRLGCQLRPQHPETLQECGFNSSHPLVMIIHGWSVGSAGMLYSLCVPGGCLSPLCVGILIMPMITPHVVLVKRLPVFSVLGVSRIVEMLCVCVSTYVHESTGAHQKRVTDPWIWSYR